MPKLDEIFSHIESGLTEVYRICRTLSNDKS